MYVCSDLIAKSYLYSYEHVYFQRHGKGKLRTSTKNVYEGEFQYNVIHGQGTMTYENTDVYKGRFRNGMVCKVSPLKYACVIITINIMCDCMIIIPNDIHMCNYHS
jgi:hypothetical protein